jgi:hypothetical protein
MTLSSLRRSKTFSVQEANRSLPLVRSIVQDWVALSAQVAERRERVAYLMAGRDPDAQDLYTDELTHVEKELKQSSESLDRYVSELNQLGIEPRDASIGLVDFPAVLDDREVYLSWELGESEVCYWRELGDSYDQRRLLEDGHLEAAGSDSGAS